MAHKNTDLQILQGTKSGDSYAAANRLASHLASHYDITSTGDESLTDWLASGDYDGSETITSIVAEWREVTIEERRNR